MPLCDPLRKSQQLSPIWIRTVHAVYITISTDQYIVLHLTYFTVMSSPPVFGSGTPTNKLDTKLVFSVRHTQVPCSAFLILSCPLSQNNELSFPSLTAE